MLTAGRQMDVDFEELALFLEALEGSDFSHFLYEKGDLRIEVRRGADTAADGASASPASASPPSAHPAVSAPQNAPAPEPAPSASVKAPAHEREAGDIDITAPLLGSVYLAPKPGEPRFVEVGSTVTAGSTVCIIEVMKLMNSVQSPVDGTVVALHVADGELVEFGHAIFTIRPDVR
jgi:acetyl-CoA carboxylase biotin carboxyl carrier protein